jgi:hypothetical protein
VPRTIRSPFITWQASVQAASSKRKPTLNSVYRVL